ncbi:MAG TPA: PA2169 family four-helix-bundle protein [Caulobacter sp.]|nr:PA2169 family four-helix-bundle protein [Caulobacter sp.]
MSKDTDTLNHIATILIDASKLYREAAEITDQPALQSELRTLTSERESLLTRFQDRVRRLGDEPRTDGSALGVGHLAFMKLRAAVQEDAKAAISEVERGEDYLRDEISKKVRDDEVSPEVRTFLAGALNEVDPGHERMSALKHQLEARA